MKIERLIGIITILLQQEKVTAPELAERFEVSRRTINRDIEAICKAGIPLVTTQGFDGGISVLDSYRIDKALFTQEELRSVLTGLKGMDSISQSPSLAGIMEKLSSKDRQITADDTITIDLASHYRDSLKEKVETLKIAVRERWMVSFCYFSEKGESSRRIEPYRVVYQWSSWYVFGYCLDREDYRLFKLNRLWDLSLLEEHYIPREIPADRLEPDTYFSAGRFHLKAKFTEGQKYRLVDEYGVDCYSLCADGSLLLENDFVSYENMRQWVLSFGDQVYVLEPEELRADLCSQAENIRRKYEEI